MSFAHFLATRLGLSPRPASRRKKPAARPRFRPMLEALEDRWVPSTLTVASAADSGAHSLRAEIKAAHSGDTINFALPQNVHQINLTSGELLINKNLTITGPGADQLTIGGSNMSRVFELSSKTKPQVTLSGLTIGNGRAANGAGILNNGTLTISNCTLSNNVATSDGGGIDNNGTLTIVNSQLLNNTGDGINNSGRATISGSTLSGNTGSGGGGIVNYKSLTISDSTLSDNTATGAIGGGGILNTGTLAINAGSTLSDNTATLGEGGGIWCGGGTVTVSGSRLLGNSAGSGGAIFSQGQHTTVTIEDSTLSGNRAANGGAIYIYSGNLTLNGSTISDAALSANSASSAGGGIYINKYATVTVENSSSITGNSAPTDLGADVYNLGLLYLDSTSTIGILDGNGTVEPI